jgi:pteridine reductase
MAAQSAIDPTSAVDSSLADRPHPAAATAPVALITGAARRIGADIARRLHAEGYALALHYRNSEDEMRALVAELNAIRADSAFALRADLGEFDRLPELVARTVGRYGRLDALINNASSYYATPFGQTTPAQWDDLFATNARAPFFLAQAAAPHLRVARGRGAESDGAAVGGAAVGGGIVNIVDIYAERPLRNHPVYCMAKAALAMMTKSLAIELGPEVRVNAIAPGNILWSDNPVKAETLDTVVARTALHRQGRPEDIAQAVSVCLASPYLTGQIIAIDGGRSLFI